MAIDKNKLTSVLAALDHDNDDHWTQSGKPSMAAVEAGYGSADVSRADVESAAPGFIRGGALPSDSDGAGDADGGSGGAEPAPVSGGKPASNSRPIPRPPKVKRATDPAPADLTKAQEDRIAELKKILADKDAPAHVKQRAQRDILAITCPRPPRVRIMSPAQQSIIDQNQARLRAASEAKLK